MYFNHFDSTVRSDVKLGLLLQSSRKSFLTSGSVLNYSDCSSLLMSRWACSYFLWFFWNIACLFQIEEITFKNYYTAYVTVRLLRRNPAHEAPAKWCTALRDLPLMDNPHTEGGSQDYYSVHRTQVDTVCVCVCACARAHLPPCATVDLGFITHPPTGTL